MVILSTHEQILEGQIYQGCTFPASDLYNAQLITYGKRIGLYLAKLGIKDHFSVDFICLQSSDTVEVFAIEINLRISGTTHPFMALQLLSNGVFDLETFKYVLNDGTERYYYCTDHCHNEAFKRLLPIDIFELSQSAKELRWNQQENVGVLFHLIGGISEFGRLGMTCVGKDLTAARQSYSNAYQMLVQEASK